jgi:hypothetical protein
LAALTASTSARAALALNGSDALYDALQSVLATCGIQFPGFPAFGVSYQGGGSSVGAFQMLNASQQISPMSRALKSNEYCGSTGPAATAGASPLLTEALLIGLDGVSVVANQTNSCSSAAANGFAVSPVMNIQTGGTGAVTGTYIFGDPAATLYKNQPSFDALAVLYFGLTHDGSYSCASDTRKSLIKNWRNVFQTDCPAGDATCTTGLTHAWRLSDYSGMTDALVSILNPPGKGIGTLPNVPVSPTPMANPFCNSLDANSPVPSTSFAGSSDNQDLDPVRTACATAGRLENVCEAYKNFTTSGAFDGDLGVVLPIVLPDATTVQASDLYPQTACSQSCTLVAPIKVSFLPADFRCPGSGNSPIQGFCFMPDIAGTTDPRCRSTNTNICFDVVGKPDGRQYNLPIVVAQSQFTGAFQKFKAAASPFQMAVNANGQIINEAFFRVHEATAGASNVPDPTVGTTGLCMENDDSSQVGCLVDSDPCSLGYASRPGARSFPGLGGVPQSAPLKALAIDGVPPFTPGPNPDLAIQNLLLPPGTTPLYPLAHRLYLNTLYGFLSLDVPQTDLYQCFNNSTITAPAMTSFGFVAIPGPVQCLNYPSNLSTSTTPAPNVQGAGNIALGGCAAGLGVRTTCP